MKVEADRADGRRDALSELMYRMGHERLTSTQQYLRARKFYLTSIDSEPWEIPVTTELDIGYSKSSISWTYESEARRSRTSTFDDEHALMGDQFIALLNAAKRLATHGAGATRVHKVHALRRIASAVSKYCSPAASPEDWLIAFSNYLRYDESTADTTRWAHFNHGSAIIAEFARSEGSDVHFRNPLKRRRVREIAITDESEIDQIVRQAKLDVFDYVNRWRAPPPEHGILIQKARELWQSGVRLSVKNSAEARLLSKEWRAFTTLPFQTLISYVYPSPADLAPFLLAIGIPLAGNPDTISLMRRDAIVPFIHPAYGSCYKLQLEKPRAGSIEPYLHSQQSDTVHRLADRCFARNHDGLASICDRRGP